VGVVERYDSMRVRGTVEQWVSAIGKSGLVEERFFLRLVVPAGENFPGGIAREVLRLVRRGKLAQDSYPQPTEREVRPPPSHASSRADVCYRWQTPGIRSATITLLRTVLRLLQECVSLSSMPDISGSEVT